MHWANSADSASRPAKREIVIRKHTSDPVSVGTLHVNFDDVTCAGPRRVIPIDKNASGDLAGKWIELTEAYQTDLVTKMGYPPPAALAYGKYPFHSVSCE